MTSLKKKNTSEMKKIDHKEEQIDFALERSELCAPISEGYRNISNFGTNVYRWKSKYGEILSGNKNSSVISY